MNKVEIKDTEKEIYLNYQKEGANKFLNVFKILLLHEDFYKTLDLLKINTKDSQKTIDSFINSIEKSEYFSKLDRNRKGQALKVTHNLLKFYYPYKIFRKDKSEPLYVDLMLNFPKIFYNVVYDDVFDRSVTEELFSKSPDIGASDNPDKPRTLQIVCDGTTTKEELIKYIDLFWEEMSLFLGKQNSEIKNTRDKSSKNFLRDVKIFNLYNSMDGISPVKREVDIARQLSAEKRMTPEVVRKSVEIIGSLKKQVNST